ncbi:MAG TPA: hypothetical protein VK821_17250 [Dehalococcoidia bacterium]|nr:hypothetical protein [Dehalococcoidia bacterium]
MTEAVALAVPDALVLRVADRIADRIERSGAIGRAWYLTTSALMGALLYMAAAWPGAHPVVQRALPVASPAVQQALPAVSPAGAAASAPQAITLRVDGTMAGTVVLEGVRAIGAASKTLVTAQSNQSGSARSETAASLSPVAAGGGSAVRAAVSVGPDTTSTASTTISATGPAVANAISGTGQVASSFGGASGDTRQPPVPQSAGPNRIAVPSGPVQPAVSAGAGPTSPGPSTGSNRITVPTNP